MTTLIRAARWRLANWLLGGILTTPHEVLISLVESKTEDRFVVAYVGPAAGLAQVADLARQWGYYDVETRAEGR